MSTTLVTAPTSEPVTVAELKAHLRIDSSEGEPAPTAPTVALAGTGAGNLDEAAYTYRVTFVTADGETEGGTVSASVTPTAGDGKVTVSAIPLGGSAVTSRKVYRTEGGGSTYKLLTTIADNTTTTYADNVADGSLGAGAPTTNTTEDPVLTALIEAARQKVEDLTGRALVTQTWDLFMDGWPYEILVPYPPLQSVTTLKYTDENGDQQTWASSNYTVDTGKEPGRIVRAYNVVWPTVRDVINNVEVRFVAGYGDPGDVPQLLKQAILVMAGHWYEERTPTVTGAIVATIPFMARSMMSTYKIHARTHA